jgi:hypothetical protein
MLLSALVLFGLLLGLTILSMPPKMPQDLDK